MTAAVVMSFDTHAFYNRLKSVGFSEQQAEAIAEIQKETATAAIEQTKHDFRLDDITTNKDLDARIKETELKIETVKADLSRLILSVGVGMGLAQLLAIFLLFMRMAGKA
jgi:hypothetical protein